MQKNISCFQVLEELYEENIDNQNLKQIVFDIAILKKYLHYWQKYSLLKEIQNMFLPRRFRGNTNCGFIEDYTSEDEIKKWNSVAVKGTTKFVLSLVFQETKGEGETIKDMLWGGYESFEADKQEELEQVGLTQEDKELIKNCFCVVKKYVDIKKKIDYPRYNMFEYSSKQLDNLKVSLLNFLKYLDDNDSLNLSYETLENYLHKENFLDVLEEMTYKLISSTSKSEMERTLIGISFLLAKVRIGITDSTALQTIEITKYKGRNKHKGGNKHKYGNELLNISTNMDLDELMEATKQLEDELEELLSPLLGSRFIRYHLYELYFKCRGNL